MALRKLAPPLLHSALAAVTAALAASLLLAGVGTVGAEPLTADACERLRAEKAGLAKAGVPGNMSKGPDWAKANLSSARLTEIERFLDVEDALAFRCVRPLPPEVVKAIEEETAGSAEPPAGPQPKAKQKGAPPAPPAKAASEGGLTGVGSDGTVVPKPKPKVRRPPPAKAKAAEGEPPQKAESKAP